MPILLIAGGARDPNLEWLARAAEAAGASVRRAFVLDRTEPGFSWQLESGAAELDGAPLAADAAFLRYDVFTPPIAKDGLDRNLAWFAALSGWANAQAGLRLFNRRLESRASLKLAMLPLARAHGLAVPATLVSNVEAALAGWPRPAIAKPAAGGGYTGLLDEALAVAGWADGRSPAPAIVQQQLEYPEYRVYRVGAAFHWFAIHSPAIDYRPRRDTQIHYLGEAEPAPGLDAALAGLCDAVGADFCACDLKSPPGGGVPMFLELNSGPMFAAFDAAAGGALCLAMVRHLLAPPFAPPAG